MPAPHTTASNFACTSDAMSPNWSEKTQAVLGLNLPPWDTSAAVGMKGAKKCAKTYTACRNRWQVEGGIEVGLQLWRTFDCGTFLKIPKIIPETDKIHRSMNGMWCELDSTEYGVNYVHGSMLSSRSLRRHAARSSCFSASWLPRILLVSPQFGQWRLAFKDFNRDIGGTTFYWPKILIRMLYTVWLCKPCACIYIYIYMYYVYIYIMCKYIY